ncbi:unnamed protein product [Blepharisma stoltei]|uniref:Peptidase A1 domain-containing protein n=1 Tax=Blepharisma stoltei TaxID=1481888 RepID=A0AAU9IFX8_9CILI|nr:unnamed protein product [Blepharisma stoltei]
MNFIFLCISLASATISLNLHSIYKSKEEALEKRFKRYANSKRFLSASSDITNYKNLQYYASFTFGTPAQTLTCLLDTGSTWIWVPQKGCTTCGTPETYYDPSKSSTYYNTTTYTSLTYLKGSSTGYISTETIGLEDGTKVTGQYFISVYAETDASGYIPDGLVGLGFDVLSDGYPSLMTTLKAQGLISKRQFAIFLGDNDWGASSESLASNIMIDGYDLAKYSTVTEFHYIPLAVNRGYWEVDCDSVKAAGTKISSSTTAVIDTGTSLIYGPLNDVNDFLYMLIKDYNCYNTNIGVVCSCNHISSLPSITFELDNIDFEVTADKYMVEEYKGYCVVEIGGSSSLDFWLLGDIFIRQYYINYDMDGKRIGFAIKAPSSSSSSSSSSSIAGWKIAVIVCTIGGVALIIAVIVLVTCIRHRINMKNSNAGGREIVVNATVSQPQMYQNQPPQAGGQAIIVGQPIPGGQGQGQPMQYPVSYPYQPSGPQGIVQNQQYGANGQPGLFQPVVAQPNNQNSM